MDWHPPSEEPKCCVGDRIVGIISYREHSGGPVRPHITVLIATEDGWDGEDGWNPECLDRWAHEKELLDYLVASPVSWSRETPTKPGDYSCDYDELFNHIAAQDQRHAELVEAVGLFFKTNQGLPAVYAAYKRLAQPPADTNERSGNRGD